MRIVIAALVFAFGFASFGNRAAAADLPMVRKAPVAAPVAYNWTGFYAGGHAGYSWADSDVAIGITDPGGVAQAIAAAGGFPIAYSISRDGYVAGGQIGYNHQFGNFVVGVEADISATGISGQQVIALPQCPICGFPNISGVSQSMDWFGTVRVRLGGAINNWLIYGTGGLAYGEVKYNYFQTNTPFGGTLNTVGSNSDVEIGWTIGAGVEYGFQRWSVKGEYLYFDLGNSSYVVPHNLVPAIVQFTPQFENKGSIARVGFNYRFN
jgi:outer membrane immunogenic protein